MWSNGHYLSLYIVPAWDSKLASRRVASRRVASRRVASRRVASRRVASRRVASHRNVEWYWGKMHPPAMVLKLSSDIIL